MKVVLMFLLSLNLAHAAKEAPKSAAVPAPKKVSTKVAKKAVAPAPTPEEVALQDDAAIFLEDLEMTEDKNSAPIAALKIMDEGRQPASQPESAEQ